MLQSESTTITAAFELFQLDNRARRFTPNTLEFYRYRIVSFAAWCEGQSITRLAQVTPAILRAYIVTLQDRNLADQTTHGHARAIRAFLNFCVREGLLADTPMRNVTMPKLGKRILPALTVDQARSVLDVCESERDKALVLFLLDTGVRASEFVALNGADIDLNTGTVRVIQGKGRKDRTGYLGNRTRKQMLRYYMAAGKPGNAEAVFRSDRTGDRLTTSGLRQLLRRLAQRAAVPNVSPHTLRRTFALWSLRSGMSIYHLARLMGHEDLTTLRRYLALVDADIEQAHKDFGVVDTML